MSAPVTGSVMIMGETERHGLGETERHGQRDRDFSGTWVPQTQETVAGRPERHGRISSWILVAVVIVAFCVGGAAIIARLWWLFWVCVGVVVVAVPVGKIAGIMDDAVLVPVSPTPHLRYIARLSQRNDLLLPLWCFAFTGVARPRFPLSYLPGVSRGREVMITGRYPLITR